MYFENAAKATSNFGFFRFSRWDRLNNNSVCFGVDFTINNWTHAAPGATRSLEIVIAMASVCMNVVMGLVFAMALTVTAAELVDAMNAHVGVTEDAPVYVSIFSGSAGRCELGENDQSFETHVYAPSECAPDPSGNSAYYSLQVEGGGITGLRLGCANASCTPCDVEFTHPVALQTCLNDGVWVDIPATGVTSRCVGPNDLNNSPSVGVTVLAYSDVGCSSMSKFLAGVSTTSLGVCQKLSFDSDTEYFMVTNNSVGNYTVKLNCNTSDCSSCVYPPASGLANQCVSIAKDMHMSIKILPNSQVNGRNKARQAAFQLNLLGVLICP